MKEITCVDGLSAFINKTVIIKSKQNPIGEKWNVRVFKDGRIGFECPEKNAFMSWMYARESGYKIFIE